jgi:signal transduction histidine kinase/DNA-binding NarL/FixJ family response regulator
VTRVLLVEDNRADARLLAELLSEVSERPFELTCVETLAAALAVGARHDVALLDLSLPDAAGIETVTRMIGALPALPIIVLTGNVDDRIALDAVAAGAQDYLRKDEITPTLVARTIRYAIERRKAEESSQQLVALQVVQRKSQEAFERARFVGDVVGAATSSLDVGACMKAVANLLVPTLGDFCAIDLRHDGGWVERIAYGTSDPSTTAILRELCAQTPGGQPAVDLLLEAMESGTSVMVPELDPATVAGDERFHALAIALRAHSILITPLIARDRVVGAITYMMGCSGRTYGADLGLVADDVASRVALGLDNGRLFADAQRAIRGRDELLAIVSHDLRNPLGVVELALGMIQRDAASLTAALPRAQRGVARMQRLIEDLLEVARIEAGTLSIQLRPTDLSALLVDLYEQHRGLAANKGIRLVREFAPRLGVVEIDADRISQAISNLLGNAIKFTPAEGAIYMSANVVDTSITISISDTGPGIAKQHVAHIFDRFWQPPDRRRDGVGLGLFIVKGIVDANGGTIDVESEEGRGATFRIALPRRLPAVEARLRA